MASPPYAQPSGTRGFPQTCQHLPSLRRLFLQAHWTLESRRSAPSFMTMKLGSTSTAFAVSVFKENANVVTALGDAHKVSMQARDGS